MIGSFLELAAATNAIGRLALATGASGLISFALAILAFALGRRYGRVADLFVALTSVLSAGLAMLLLPETRAVDSQLAIIAFGLGIAGAFAATFGAILAATEATGWFLAQLYVAVGYALVGGWLLIVNMLARSVQAFPNRAVSMGVLAAVVMMLGVAALPGILARAETEGSSPWISRHVARAGYFGWSILYPIWCIWLGQSRLPS